MSNSALLVVDIQNDFFEGGSLAVDGADASLVTLINDLMVKAKAKGFKIIGTKDFHPTEHISFSSNEKMYEQEEFVDYIKYQAPYFWPDHCVIETKGEEIVDGLKKEMIEKFFHKGTNVLIDSYSAFFSNGDIINKYFIEKYLDDNNIKNIYLCGVALDFCVLHNGLDARKLGYNVCLIEDASKPVFPQKIDETLAKYRDAGIKIISSDEF